MSLILGGRDGDVLGSRVIQDLFAELDRLVTEQAAYMAPGQYQGLLDGIVRDFRGERDWEEHTTESLELALDDLSRSADLEELERRYSLCLKSGGDYFNRRQSVLALHTFCTRSRDLVVRWAIREAETRLGSPPSAYSCCAIGYCGRSEATLTTSCNFLLISKEERRVDSDWFYALADEISATLDKLGIIGSGGMKPIGYSSIMSMAGWLERLTSLTAVADSMGEVARICDLRLIHGDAVMAETLHTTAYESLRSNNGNLTAALRNVATRPVGLDFFGRLKMEKGGRHAGEFNLIQSTLTPLVLTIRMLAVRAGIADTSTPDRIRKLLEVGELGVAQTANLLKAYHDFIQIKVSQEIVGKGSERFGFYLEPDEITHEQEQNLKHGLDAVFHLQRIVYQSIGG